MISNAECNAGARAIFGEAENRGGVETQAGRFDLRADTDLTETFRAQRRVAAARVGASVDFADEIDALVNAENSRQTVKQNVVLRESFNRRSHNSQTEIAENIDARSFSGAFAKLFLRQNFAENVDLIRADAARLIGIRQLETEFEAERGQISRFIAQLDFRRNDKIACIVRRITVESQRNRRNGRRGIDSQKILQNSFDLKFDVRRETDAQANVANARLIASQTRQRKFSVLQKINARADLNRAFGRNINVFGQQRALLRVSAETEAKS